MDDLMLNIVTPSANKSKATEPGLSKTDAKKIKYSAKLKMKKKGGREKSGSLGLSSGMISSDQGASKSTQQLAWEAEKKIASSYNKSYSHAEQKTGAKEGEQSKPRKQRNFRRRQNDGQQGPAQSKRPISRSKVSQNVTFRPEQRKDLVVQQLMPEKNEEKNHIDTNSLQNFPIQPKVLDSLVRSGVTKMTEIQLKSFQTLASGVDCVIKASTGSGKTLAYLIPLVNRLVKNKTITKREDGTAILVVCPTRELCVQGHKEANRCLKRCPFIISGSLFGGEETNHEKARLRKGTNILFCTPGRVLYHLEHTQSFKLANMQAIVFEEADRTLDMGFQESIHKILAELGNKVPLSHLHKILVSAHFNSKVSSLLEELEMNEPQFIGFGNMDQEMKIEKLKESKDVEINTSDKLKQQYVLMSEEEKIPLMLAYLGVLKNCKALIFVSTIDEVEFLDYLFNNLKFKDSNGNDTDLRFENRTIYKIHGDLDQKLRSKTYLEFRESKEAILISTEVASRGLDFPDLSHIILFDVPPTITDYGNRVGRSARFNQTGVSLLMLHYLESDYAEKIRYYAPTLQVIDKDLIYESFSRVLKSMNIGDSSLHYIEGLVRASVKNDDEKYQVARKAYVSMLRAYARLPEKHIFAVKKLNLKLLARSFGLNNAQADSNYNPKAKSSYLEANRKKRKVENIKKVEVSEYL